MTRNVDDIHKTDKAILRARERLKNSEIGQDNIYLIERFVVSCRREELSKQTILWYIDYSTWLAQRLKDIGFDNTIDKMEQDDFDRLLLYLEDEKGLSQGTLRNYRKLVKKLYGWAYNGEPPRWVKELKLKFIDTPVQPSDLLTQAEFDRLMEACRHPRDKALIAALADSGMRVGAMASCRIKHVEFNQYGAILYISQTSKSKKTTPAKGIPLTWSTGYINQWLAVHPLKEDPEAPLWVTHDKNTEALTYKSVRMTIMKIAERAGIKKRVNPHSFRHLAITQWILDGYNEQQIKHRAGWSKGSAQMFKVYANFTDQEINDGIFEKCGLKTEDKRHVTLKKCPRCSNVLRPTDKFCSQCSLVLDRQAYDEIKQYEDKLPEILQMVMRSEKARELMGGVGKG